MQIHQFVHTLNYGDAISGEALTIRRVLREMGIESNIYSVHAHEKVKEFAINLLMSAFCAKKMKQLSRIIILS